MGSEPLFPDAAGMSLPAELVNCAWRDFDGKVVAVAQTKGGSCKSTVTHQTMGMLAVERQRSPWSANGCRQSYPLTGRLRAATSTHRVQT